MLKLGTLCYVDSGTHYLLLHRNKKENDVHEGKWIGVGGKVEEGETPLDCVKREVFEETGLIVANPLLKGIITFPNFDGANDWLVFVYKATQFSGELGDCAEGELEWVSYNHVLDKPTWEGDRHFLKWLLQDKPFFTAKMCYDKKQLIDYTVQFEK